MNKWMIWGAHPYFWKHPSFRFPRIWSIHWHYRYTLRKKHESRDGISNWLWLDLPRASPIWRSPILCLANHSAWSELSILSSKPTQNWKFFWISNTKKMQKVHLHGRKNPSSNVWVIKVDIVSDFVSDTVTGIADGVHGMLNFATRRNGCHDRSWGDSGRFPRLDKEVRRSWILVNNHET